MTGNILYFIRQYTYLILLIICIIGLAIFLNLSYSAYIHYFSLSVLLFPGIILAEYYVTRNGEIFGVGDYFKLITFSYPAFLSVWLLILAITAATSWFLLGTKFEDAFMANMADIHDGSYLNLFLGLFIAYALFTGITLPVYAAFRRFVFCKRAIASY